MAGLLVAVKQLFPEAELRVAGVARLRGKHGASAFLAAYCPARVLLGAPHAALHAAAGAAAAWGYLRHYQARFGPSSVIMRNLRCACCGFVSS